MGRPMSTQVAQIQKEVTPGTAVTNAMLRPSSLKLRPSVHVEGGEEFAASGANATTAYVPGDEWGLWSVEGIQDFNTLGFAAESLLGESVTNVVEEGTGGGPDAIRHVWTPKAYGLDAIASYTAQFGDSTICIQGTQFTFQTLGIGVQRSSLTLTSSALSRALNFGATLATSGVITVPAVPIHPTRYDVYADDEWEDLGTTKLLSCYQFTLTNPDKFTPDAPINSAVQGFESLMVTPDRQLTVDIEVALDAAAVALVNANFRAGQIKFFRIESKGATIAGDETYKLTYDVAVLLTSVGEAQGRSGSNVAVLPMQGRMIIDPVSGKYQELALVNTIAGY